MRDLAGPVPRRICSMWHRCWHASVVILSVFALPLCGSQDSGSQKTVWQDMNLESQGKVQDIIGNTASGMVTHLRYAAFSEHPRLAENTSLIASRTGVKKASKSSPLKSNLVSQYEVGRSRRGLQSGALRMLFSLAKLVLPRETEALLPRVHTEANMPTTTRQVSGGWAETYACLLSTVLKGLRAERSREEEREQKEDGSFRTEILLCRSRLAQVQNELVSAVRDQNAIGHSLRVWQRIRQGLEEQGRKTTTESTSDVEGKAKAAASIKRLKADHLRSDLDARALKAQEKLQNLRCSLMEWQEAHRAEFDVPRTSKLLRRAEDQIDALQLDAPALLNISRSIPLNVTLQACYSGGQSYLPSILQSALGQNNAVGAGRASNNVWDILAVLQRSLQQASQNIFLELTERTLECEEQEEKVRLDTDTFRHESLDLVKIKGDIQHLERTVATMQTELLALQTAQREAQGQVVRLEAAMGGAQLHSQQYDLCSDALTRLQQQQDAASAKANAKEQEMAVPQLEIARFRRLLNLSLESESISRRKMTRDRLRRSRCSIGWRTMRRNAAILARHSQVLSFIVEDYRLRR